MHVARILALATRDLVVVVVVKQCDGFREKTETGFVLLLERVCIGQRDILLVKTQILLFSLGYNSLRNKILP